MLKPKYKLRGRPVLTFSLRGEKFAPPSPSVTPLAMIYFYLHTVNCPYTAATRHELVASLNLRERLQFVSLIYVLVELILGNAFTLIVT